MDNLRQVWRFFFISQNLHLRVQLKKCLKTGVSTNYPKSALGFDAPGMYVYAVHIHQYIL